MYNTQQYHRVRLWCLTIFQLYHDGQFYWWRKTGIHRENHRPQVADKVHHIKLFRLHLVMSGIQTHNYSGDRH